MAQIESSIQLAARLDSLDAATRFIQVAAHSVQLPQNRLGHLELILEELFVNICLHAYPPGSLGSVQLTCTSPSPGELRVELTDQGFPYNPLEAPTPDLDVPLKNRPTGGLGIFIVREWTDEIHYVRDNTSNRITFTISGASPVTSTN
jgi:serine/threonine-protein kinase RsbW